MMKSLLTRNNILIGSLVLLAVGPFLYVMLGILLDLRRPVKYLIPQVYVGWIRIEYRVKNAPPLPQEGMYMIVKVPATGILKTSSVMGEGWAVDKYYYVTSKGVRQPLPLGLPGEGMIHANSGEPHGANEKFFVGTKQQLDKFGWSRVGQPGPIIKGNKK
jgi:hypothetical protein